MVAESGSFFQKVYQSNQLFDYMGFCAAGLNEIFMAILAGVWLPDIKGNRKSRIHPGNIVFKTLLIFLFLTTVGGASLNVVFPIVESIQKRSNNNQLIDLLKTQADDSQRALTAFTAQNQRVNTALSVRQQFKIKSELKRTIREKRPTVTLWFEIFLVVLIRFGIQLANLSCVWLAGWLYRRDADAKSSSPLSPSVRLTGEGTKEQPSRGLIGKHAEVTQREGRRVGTSPSSSRKKRSKLIPINGIKKRTSTSRRVEELSTSRHLTPSHRVIQLRREITRLLKSRNEGVTLSQICGAIEERESAIRNILYSKASVDRKQEATLETILNKIEKLYTEENARAF